MPSYTSSTRLARVQYDPALDGTIIATSFFETTLTNDDDPTDVSVKPWEVVTHEVHADAAELIEQAATTALDAKLEKVALDRAAAKAAIVQKKNS